MSFKVDTHIKRLKFRKTIASVMKQYPGSVKWLQSD